MFTKVRITSKQVSRSLCSIELEFNIIYFYNFLFFNFSYESNSDYTSVNMLTI